MKSKIFFLALSALSLMTACSNDETIEMNQGNAISFHATAGRSTRTVETTTSSINSFKVWAYTDGKTYMDGVVVNKNNSTWSYTNRKFWPDSDVNFFSVSPDSLTLTNTPVATTDTKITLNDYEVPGNVDLLYATNKGEKKADHLDKAVQVNFRHALSQIIFKIKNINPKLKVQVDGVKIDGIQYKGTLAWASQTTAPNKADGNDDTETDPTWGTWDRTNDLKKATVDATGTYPGGYDADITAYALTAGNATATPVDLTRAENGAYHGSFLLPQTLDTWTPVKGTKPGEYTATGTARLLVKCLLKDADTDIQLWPDGAKKADQTAWVAISLKGEDLDGSGSGTDTGWKQGKKYTYTLIFGEGAGYNPDPNNPNPVLVPITFDVTVDAFQNGGEIEAK